MNWTHWWMFVVGIVYTYGVVYSLYRQAPRARANALMLQAGLNHQSMTPKEYQLDVLQIYLINCYYAHGWRVYLTSFFWPIAMQVYIVHAVLLYLRIR